MNEEIDPESVRKIALAIAKPLAGGDFMLAKDVASDVMMKIMAKLERGESVVRESKKLRAYIEQMVVNMFLNIWEAEEVREAASANIAIEAELRRSALDDPERTLDAKELTADVNAALNQLSEREKQVLCFRYLNDLQFKQISELLGLKVDTVKEYRNNAFAKLQVLLKPHGPDLSPKGQS